MQYITVIRGLCLMLLGIVAYSVLLWIFGRRIPGRLRRDKKESDSRYGENKERLVLRYHLILAILILLGYLGIKYMVRGEL